MRARTRLDMLKKIAHDGNHTTRLTHLLKLVEQPPTLFDV